MKMKEAGVLGSQIHLALDFISGAKSSTEHAVDAQKILNE